MCAPNAVEFRREAGRENRNSMRVTRIHKGSVAWPAATRGYAMLGGLGGRRGPLGSVPRYGVGISIASLPLKVAKTVQFVTLGRTPITMAMFQQQGQPGSWI